MQNNKRVKKIEFTFCFQGRKIKNCESGGKTTTPSKIKGEKKRGNNVENQAMETNQMKEKKERLKKKEKKKNEIA